MNNSITPNQAPRRSRRYSTSTTADSSSASSSSASRRGRRPQLQLPTQNLSVARRLLVDSDDNDDDSSVSSSRENVVDSVEVFIDDGITEEAAIAEMNEVGVGGNSDDEDGDFLEDIQNCATEVADFRNRELDFDEMAVVGEVDQLENVDGRRVEINNENDSDSDSDDKMFELRKLQQSYGPSIPSDWSPPVPKTSKGQP